MHLCWQLGGHSWVGGRIGLDSPSFGAKKEGWHLLLGLLLSQLPCALLGREKKREHRW